MNDIFAVHVGNRREELGSNFSRIPFGIRKAAVEISAIAELHDDVDLGLILKDFKGLSRNNAYSRESSAKFDDILSSFVSSQLTFTILG